MADVCGHGVEAAKLTALARYTLRTEAAHHGAKPREVVLRLHQALITQHGRRKTLAAALATLRPGTRRRDWPQRRSRARRFVAQTTPVGPPFDPRTCPRRDANGVVLSTTPRSCSGAAMRWCCMPMGSPRPALAAGESCSSISGLPTS
jgi:hypothetical protein